MIRFERSPLKLPQEELRDKAHRYEGALESTLAKSDLTVSDAERLVDIGVDAAALRNSVDPKSDRILQSLRTAACGAAALFALAASSPGQQVSLRFPDGRERLLTSSGWTNSANSTLWGRGFFATMASRQYEALEVLAGIPMDLLRRSSTQTQEWQYLRFEAFAAFARRDPDAPQREVVALKAADPDLAPPSFTNYILDIASTDLALLYEVMTRDQAGFDKALLTALKGHKHYYSRGDAKHDILGQLALSPLALCVAAKDSGMSINVESDYIPRSVIDA